MSKTREQLVAMAADELLLVGAGQALEAEDSDKIDSRVDGLFAELSVRIDLNIPDEDEIPDEFTATLAELLANASAPAFGAPKKPDMEREAIESRLRVIICRQQASDDILTTDLPSRSRAPMSLSSWRNGRW